MHPSDVSKIGHMSRVTKNPDEVSASCHTKKKFSCRFVAPSLTKVTKIFGLSRITRLSDEVSNQVSVSHVTPSDIKFEMVQYLIILDHLTPDLRGRSDDARVSTFAV